MKEIEDFLELCSCKVYTNFNVEPCLLYIDIMPLNNASPAISNVWVFDISFFCPTLQSPWARLLLHHFGGQQATVATPGCLSWYPVSDSHHQLSRCLLPFRPILPPQVWHQHTAIAIQNSYNEHSNPWNFFTFKFFLLYWCFFYNEGHVFV